MSLCQRFLSQRVDTVADCQELLRLPQGCVTNSMQVIGPQVRSFVRNHTLKRDIATLWPNRENMCSLCGVHVNRVSQPSNKAGIHPQLSTQ